MSLDKDTATASKNGGESISDTPSITLLNRRLGTSPAPRMLTKSEIELLRQSEREVIRVARAVLASKSGL